MVIFALLFAVLLLPRSLDGDLQAVCKAAQADWEWQRIPFVLGVVWLLF